MRNSVKYNLMAVASFMVLSLTSCVKKEIFYTPHPDKGVMAAKADFTSRSQECPVPQEYRLLHTCCGEASPYILPSAEEKNLSELFEPDSHVFHAWNECEGMTVSAGKINIDIANGNLENMPGYIFTSRMENIIVKDDTTRIVIPMQQRVRDVHFDITVTEGDPELIASVTGTLTGVASIFDIENQTIIGEGQTTTINFSRNGDKLLADVRLLGFIGSSPTLTLDVQFVDDREQTVDDANFAEAVKNFGSNMTETLVLTNNMNTPIETGMEATIEDWQAGNGSGDNIEIQ